MKTFPDFSFEEELWASGFTVIGIDEVGRGAFAGPVGVGGVVFDPEMTLKSKKALLGMGINDSKKLSSKRREELSLLIRETATAYFVTFIDVVLVNKYGVGRATEKGMIEVINKVERKNEKVKSDLFALIDGFKVSGLTIPQRNIIRGDSLSMSIAAASIIAKVERDSLMDELSYKFPLYGFDKNKGYGTKYHRERLVSNGITYEHRTEFCRKTLMLV